MEQNAGSSVDLIASQENSVLILQHVCQGKFFFLLYLCGATGIIHQKLRVEQNNFEAESELGRRSLSRLRELLLFIFFYSLESNYLQAPADNVAGFDNKTCI